MIPTMILRLAMNKFQGVSSDTTGGKRRTSSRVSRSGGLHGRRPSPERDAHLVARARRGDQNAFRQLVLAYQERIFVVVRSMVRNQEDARDIAQDVFIKAYASLGSFRGQSSFYTWLYRIAVNMAIDFRRKMDRKPSSAYDDQREADGAEGAFVPDARQFSPERALKDKELGRHIMEAVDQLPEEQRTAIILRELEGLSYKEIAEVMGCSQGTVMSRLFYGRKKLQERLKDFL